MSEDPFDHLAVGFQQPSFRRVYSVTELTQAVRFLLEEAFPEVWVEGEISNFKRHASGHIYFSLKDAEAQIACVMWRGKNMGLLFEPQDGMRVRVLGSLTVYERQGKYQLDVHRILLAGRGELQLAFERLKRRLYEEGLFDPARKKPLPIFPRRIGIVTSPTGAAIHDILSVGRRRYPGAHFILAPVRVQGESAATEIAEAIRAFNAYGQVDVIIIGRGGGSFEDLWAFNEEVVARAIDESRIPIVSAVGHDIDYAISDFVADVRAPTPSAAAELVVPDREAWRVRIGRIFLQMTEGLKAQIHRERERIEAIRSRWAFRIPSARIREYRLRLDELSRYLEDRIVGHLKGFYSSLEAFQTKLGLLHPYTILKRGYSITTRQADGQVVRDAAQLREGDRIHTLFARGSAQSLVHLLEVEPS